jgi:hypothetical protein
MNLNVTISPTADSLGEYMQIMSDDLTSVNIVLVAEHIEIDVTTRTTGPKPAPRGSPKPRSKKRKAVKR